MLYSVHFNKENIEENDKKNRLNNVESLSLDSLIERMKGKEAVKVVSCYYGIDALNCFLGALTGRGRTTDVILCATGVSKESWIAQMDQLIDKVELGQNQNVYLYTKFSLLHSKIYFSVSKRYENKSAYGATCLVGSANLSENAFKCNEEILVDVKDDETKQAIEDYIDNLLTEGTHLYSVRKLKNKKNREKNEFNLRDILKAPETTDSVLDYILSGFLFFKAPRNFSLGFGDDEWRKDINVPSSSEYIKDSKSLDVAAVLDVKGYDEIDEPIDASEMDDGKKNKKKKVSIAANSIETCFGYWVPAEKKDFLEKQIYGDDKKNSQRKQNYAKIVEALRENQGSLKPNVRERLIEAFKAVNLEEEKFPTYEEKIVKHIDSKIRYYEKNKAIYLKKGFCITPMPNIFEDPASSIDFLDSLWDSICTKSNCQEAKKKDDPLAKILYALFLGSEGKMLGLSNDLNELPF